MDFEKLKIQVDYLEDKVSINFDKYFNQLVLVDFYEGGFDERIEDEMFYEEYYSKYEDAIVDLLLDLEENMESEVVDLKLRLIKLKRIIDNKLINLVDTLDSSIKRVKRRNVQFIFSQEIEKEKFIDTLFNQLIKVKLIKTDNATFKSHFSLHWEGKIQWLGTELQIANLITLLIENNYLSYETKRFKYKLICSHFINKRGNEFKEKQLGSVFSENKDKTFHCTLNEIIDELSTHFPHT